MMFRTWLAKLINNSTKTCTFHLNYSRRHSFERLEDRVVLSANIGELPFESSPVDGFPLELNTVRLAKPYFSEYSQVYLPFATSFSQPSQIFTPDLSEGKFQHKAQIFSQDILFPLLDSNRSTASNGLQLTQSHTRQTGRTLDYDVNRINLTAFVGYSEIEPEVQFGQFLDVSQSEHFSSIPHFAIMGSSLLPPTGSRTEILATARAMTQEGTTLSFVRVSGTIASVVVLEPSLTFIPQISVNTQINLSSRNTKPEVIIFPLRRFVENYNSLVNDVTKNLQMDNLHSKQTSDNSIAPDGLVDVGILDEEISTNQLTESHLRKEWTVSQLLGKLHSPPMRSIEINEPNLPPFNEADVLLSQDIAIEGGMVLLQRLPHTRSNELILDEAFADFGATYGDVRVRMESSTGVYQAFDVGWPAEFTAQDTVRPAFSSKPISVRSEEDSAIIQFPQAAGVGATAAIGIAASAVVVISNKLSIHKRKLHAVGDATSALFRRVKKVCRN